MQDTPPTQQSTHQEPLAGEPPHTTTPDETTDLSEPGDAAEAAGEVVAVDDPVQAAPSADPAEAEDREFAELAALAQSAARTELGEAADQFAERCAQALRNLLKRLDNRLAGGEPRTPARLGETSPAEQPLFVLRTDVLYLALGTLTLPEADSDSPVILEISRDTTRIIVPHGDHTFWVELPAENNVPEGASVVFETPYKALRGLSLAPRVLPRKFVNQEFRRAPFGFYFDAKRQNLLIRESPPQELQINLPAKAATLPSVFLDSPTAVQTKPVQSQEFRRVLPYAGAILTSSERDKRFQYFHLNGGRFHGQTRKIACLIDFKPATDLDLFVPRADARALSRALHQMTPANTKFIDCQTVHVFSDDMFSFAFKPSKGSEREPPNGFDGLVLASLQFRTITFYQQVNAFAIFPSTEKNIELRVRFAGNTLKLSILHERISRRTITYDLTNTIIGIPMPPSDTPTPDEEVAIQIEFNSFHKALSMTTADWVRLDVLAAASGKPAWVLLDSNQDGIRYRALLTRYNRP